MMLTPPPSVSGESLARSTPPAASATDIYGRAVFFDHNEAPLDLTKDNEVAARGHHQQKVTVNTPKSSPVILEPVTPPWKSAGESAPSSMRSSPAFPSTHLLPESSYIDHHQQQQQDAGSLDYDEQMAVTALLSLSRATAARC